MFIFTKGAPDYLLFEDLSREDSPTPISQVIKGDGEVIEIEADEVELPQGISTEEGETDTHKIMFEKGIEVFAKKAYRTIMLAYRVMPKEEYDDLAAGFNEEADKYVLEENLTAIGLFGIEDPLRNGIKEAVDTCTKKSGITVVMCTGDAL